MKQVTINIQLWAGWGKTSTMPVTAFVDPRQWPGLAIHQNVDPAGKVYPSWNVTQIASGLAVNTHASFGNKTQAIRFAKTISQYWCWESSATVFNTFPIGNRAIVYHAIQDAIHTAKHPMLSK